MAQLRSAHNPTTISSPSTTVLALVGAFSATVAAVPRLPDTSEGSIEPSGKFTPARPAEPAPGEKPGPKPTRPEADRALEEAATVRQTGEHTFVIGKVSLDRKARTITLPAQVNMREGILEYGLVAGTGKVHESLLRTAAEPEHIHVAALLLGMKVTRPVQREDRLAIPPAARIDKIEVTWPKHGPAARYRLEELILTHQPDGGESDPEPVLIPVMETPWLYCGSRFEFGHFLARQEGSFISLIHDRAALVLNPDCGWEQTRSYFANTRLLPPEGRDVKVILTLTSPKQETQPSP